MLIFDHVFHEFDDLYYWQNIRLNSLQN